MVDPPAAARNALRAALLVGVRRLWAVREAECEHSHGMAE
jgi:hypothetical protein